MIKTELMTGTQYHHIEGVDGSTYVLLQECPVLRVTVQEKDTVSDDREERPYKFEELIEFQQDGVWLKGKYIRKADSDRHFVRSYGTMYVVESEDLKRAP